jgi:hypothetical protein
MQLLPHGSSNDYQLFKYSRQAGDTGTAAWRQCSQGKTCNGERPCDSSELHLHVASSIDSGHELTFTFRFINPITDTSAGNEGNNSAATLKTSATRGSNTNFVREKVMTLETRACQTFRKGSRQEKRRC